MLVLHEGLTLPAGACYTAQQLVNKLQEMPHTVDFNAGGPFVMGDTTPTADYREYPWYKTNDTEAAPEGWYRYNGTYAGWIQRHWVKRENVWMPFETDIVNVDTFDGGDANAIGPASGPMWIDEIADEPRFIINAGTKEDSTTIEVGDEGGEENHTLTEAELPDVSPLSPWLADGAGAEGDTVTWTFGTRQAFAGSNHVVKTSDDVYANRYNPACSSIGDGESHNNTPKYRAARWLLKSARKYYLVPG